MPPRSTSARARNEERVSAGELRQWGGTVAATVIGFAGALETGPEAVCEAMQDAGVTPMVDTARRGDKSTDKHDERPDDPGRRSLALTTEDFQAVAEEAET